MNARATATGAGRALLDALSGCERVLLTGPLDPDGDSLGACLTLQRVLRAQGVPADVTGEPSYRYTWMPGAHNLLSDDALKEHYDAVVVLDGDRHRLTPGVHAAFERAPVKGIIDHHASTRPDGYTVLWLDAAATSTCEMIYELLGDLGHPVDTDIAALLYAGAIFDTGGFRHSNTTPQTHRMAAHLLSLGIDHASISAKVLMERRQAGVRAAGRVLSGASFALDGALAIGAVPLSMRRELGLLPGDLEGIVDGLVHTVGVEVAVLLIQHSDQRVKASLRSGGSLDVAALAQRLAPSGGGHQKAAGALIEAPVAEAETRVREVVAAMFQERVP